MARLRPAAVSVLLLLAAVAVAGLDVDSLVADLAGTDAARRSAAYATLIRAKDPAAIEPLVNALPSLEVSTQYQAMQILGAYPATQSDKALRGLTKTGGPFVRMAAGEILYRHGDRRAARVVADALRDAAASVDVKQRMLTRLCYGHAPAEKAVAKALRDHLTADQDPSVICGALRVIQGQPDPRATPVVAKLAHDARPGVRAVALAFLYGLGDETRAQPLADVFATGKVPYTEMWTSDVLLRERKGGVAAAIPEALTKLLATTTDASILRGLAGFLERLRYRAAVPELRKLMAHENSSVSHAAMRAVAALTGAETPSAPRPGAPAAASSTAGAAGLGGTDTEMLAKLIKTRDKETLRAWLKDKDAARRLMAADALRRMDDPSGLSVVIAEIMESASTQHYWAARVLGAFVDPRAVPPLLDALADKEVRVRQIAQSGLQKLLTRLFPYRRIELTSTGYTAYGDADKRAAAIKTLRAWWAENRKKDW